MKVEQAIFGEVRGGGHGLRLASKGALVSRQLGPRLDLPDTAPQGTDWSPFLSGFPYGDHYILARTLSDPTATRGGMVLSHAIIAPLYEMTATADLRPLLALLIASPEMPATLDACEVPPSTGQPPAAGDLGAASEALASSGRKTVVRMGHQGFEELVASLWFHFWPELRATFAFRLSFGPPDLVEDSKPALVCTPSSLKSRWTGYPIVGSTSFHSVSRSAAMLRGEAEAEPMFRFARDLGARLGAFADLPPLELAFACGTGSDPSFEECVRALRQMERLSPDPAAGIAGKARLVDRLVSRLPAATVQDVRLLRNLPTAALPSADKIWKELQEWAAGHRFTPSEDEPFLSALDDAFSTEALIPAWREAFLGGVKDASRSASSSFPAAFWRWVDAQPATVTALADHLPAEPQLEARLAEAAPSNLTPAIGEAVMALALSKGWLQLHGAAAGRALAPHDAVQRQIAADKNPEVLDGLRAALRRATPAQVLDIALQSTDTRVLCITGEEVARDPSLIKGGDFQSETTQAVWAHALALNPEAWRGPKDPRQAFAAVLDNLIDDGPVKEDLIAALSSSPLADLCDYPRRVEIWRRLDHAVRIPLLRATATGWLERAMGTAVPFDPDPDLQDFLLTNEVLDRTLRVAIQTNVEAALRVVSALPGYEESRFMHWLEDLVTSRRPFVTAEAETLGRLLLERRWQKAVNELVSHVRKGREEFAPALRMCQGMIASLDRWFLGLSPISRDDKWQALEALAVTLYPNGSDEKGLWHRAGGHTADLRHDGSGRDQWHDAIRAG